MHTTRVNVKRSEIKYLDPDTETVEDFLINGRITVINAKKMVKDTNPNAVFISKENLVHTVTVNTQSLIDLADEESNHEHH